MGIADIANRKSALRSVAFLLLAAGASSLAAGAYIPAKAALAQVLLDLAWSHTEDSGDRVRPWPWAETWPVARLTAPRLGADLIVLAGAEGAALAFAPGHVDGTALPPAAGNTVVAGHRDTHFRFLKDLRIGDELWLESADGERRRFNVTDARVVHEDDLGPLAPTPEPALTLVTCYPFEAVWPGGALRYVVYSTLMR